MRDGNGGYRTVDGRWTVTPCVMGDGVNSNGGWSTGRKSWALTDTTGQATLGLGGSRKILDRLYEVKDVIAWNSK